MNEEAGRCLPYYVFYFYGLMAGDTHLSNPPLAEAVSLPPYPIYLPVKCFYDLARMHVEEVVPNVYVVNK